MKINSIASRSAIASAVLILGCLGMLGTTYYAIQKLRVGGPTYQNIILGKDLLADILPPPEYIVEPYLEATLAFNDPSSAQKHAERLTALRKDYDVRHQFWIAQEFDSSIRTALTSDAHKPAMVFWTTTQDELIPALLRGDSEAAKATYAKLTEAYNEHRSVIDKVVENSNAYVAKIEKNAAAEGATLMNAIVTVSAIMLSLLLLCAFAMARGLVKPLVGITASMYELTAGHFEVAIAQLGRKDEIGNMAKALVVFRDAGLENRRLAEEAEI
ncbi:MAG: HAMP domain-containing protein, partial [Hyphomicrobium sp.]